MHRAERIVIYSLLALALGVALHAAGVVRTGSGGGSVALAATPAPARAEPAASKIAVCDLFGIVEKFVDMEPFATSRKGEEDRLKGILAPLEAELDRLEKELQKADPNDPAARAKAGDFQQKRQQYSTTQQTVSQQYAAFVSGQFIDGYDQVRAKADSVAAGLGYNVVISSRALDRKITADDPQRLVDEFLGRPVVKIADEANITKAVMAALKIEDKPAETPPPAAGTPAGPDAKPTEKPAK